MITGGWDARVPVPVASCHPPSSIFHPRPLVAAPPLRVLVPLWLVLSFDDAIVLVAV